MPYFRLGSLDKEHGQNPLAEKEIIDLLFQALTVLNYLHLCGVAYRDLKPENILVERRPPLRLQFTDFGLANDQPDLKTFCGTKRYVAPEVCGGGSYTTAVDVWSLGVMILEYMYGLPGQLQQAGKRSPKERGLAWCRRLVRSVNDRDLDPVIDLLATGMLQIDPRQRLSAGACLMKARNLRLFDDPSVDSGGPTPTPQTVEGRGTWNEGDSPTMITGALWGSGGKGSNLDGNGQAECRTPDRPGISEAVSGRLSGNVPSPLEAPCPPEARSIYPCSKRHRSPAVSSPSDPPDKSRSKRRPLEARVTEPRTSGTPEIPLAPDDIQEVTEAAPGYVKMTIDGQIVLLQEKNRLINATQIIKLKCGTPRGDS